MKSACMLVLSLLLVGCQRSYVAKVRSIEGVWKVVETRSDWGRGIHVNPAPQHGLYLFTRRHYSIVWVPVAEPRKGSAKPWFPVDAEKIYDFDTVIVNSGTYETADSMLTTRPYVAKTPEFMGGWAAFRYRVAVDTLWLTGTDIYSRDGIRDPGVDAVRTTVKLVRVKE